MSKNSNEQKKPASLVKHMLIGTASGAAAGAALSIISPIPSKSDLLGSLTDDGVLLTPNMNVWQNRENIIPNLKLLLFNRSSVAPPEGDRAQLLYHLSQKGRRKELRDDLVFSTVISAAIGASIGFGIAVQKNKDAPKKEVKWQDRVKIEEHAPEQLTQTR